MRKIFTTIAALILSFTVFCACNPFKDGSVDELYGIYGVQQYFFRALDDTEYNYADTYDYYLLVVYESGTADVYYKKTDANGETYSEHYYSTTYTIGYETDENGKDTSTVNNIKVANFQRVYYKDDRTNITRCEETVERGFSLYPKLENLTDRSATFGPGTPIKTYVNKLTFHKMYGSIDDDKIERAKEKQTKERANRVLSDD